MAEKTESYYNSIHPASINLVLNEMHDDLTEVLIESGIAPKPLLDEIGIINRIMTIDDLKKTGYFKPFKESPIYMENSSVYRKTFDVDLDNLSTKEEKVHIMKWEFKILLKHLLDWLDNKFEENIKEIVLHTYENGIIVLNRITLANKEKIDIYEDILKTLSAYAKNLPRRNHNTVGSFGIKPFAMSHSRIIYKGTSVSARLTKDRYLKFYAGESQIAYKTAKSMHWMEGELTPLGYATMKELEVIEKLMGVINYVEEENSIKKKFDCGRGASSRKGKNLNIFFSKFDNGEIKIKIRAGQETHEDLNYGGKENGYADFVLDPECRLYNKNDPNSTPFSKIEARFKDVCEKTPFLEIYLEELAEIKNRLQILQERDNIAWTDEQVLSIIINYLITRRFKDIARKEDHAVIEVSEIFSDAFSRSPQQYMFVQKIGIGEIFGPRTKGKESTWIVDHIAAFEIKKGYPNNGKLVLIWINDKQFGTIARSGNKWYISKDLRNHFNLMRMVFYNRDGKPIIGGVKGGLWKGGNFLAVLEKGEEKNAWKKIKELIENGHVVEQYGIYQAFDVIEDFLEDGTIAETILVDLQVFQIESL